MTGKYDIFISYRRQGGDTTARILCERFTDLGYKVFFDVENLRAGDFNTELYDVIDQCNDFLIILSPDALDRCENEGDWVRNELAYALKKKKNIVPVLLRGFTFPDKLPEDIKDVRFKNGLEASSEFFDAFVARLQKFLVSKPLLYRRFAQNNLVRKTLPFFIALVSLCVIIAVVYFALPKTFPHSQEDKNTTSELLSDMSLILSGYNTMASLEQGALEESAGYLISQNPVVLETTLTTIDNAINGITGIKPEKAEISTDLSSRLNKTPIDKGDIQMFLANYQATQVGAADNLRLVKFILSDSVFSGDIKAKIVGLYMDMNTLSAKYVIYLTNAAVLEINGNHLSEFKKALTYFTSLPYEGYTWLTDRDELGIQMASTINKLENAVGELSSITGDQNIEYVNMLEDYKKELDGQGYSQAEIDTALAGIVRTSKNTLELKKSIQKNKEELIAVKSELLAANERARQKFKPEATDNEGILWGKMLRFLTLKMPEDAKSCLDMYYEKVKEADRYAAAYVPIAKSFIDSMQKTGIDYGVIIIGYEPGLTSHPIYEIGEIIVAVNGERCLNADSLIARAMNNGDTVTVLKFDGQRPLFITKVYEKTGKRVAFMSLTERGDEESTKPFLGLDPNALWDRAAKSMSDFQFQQADDCLQMYHMLVRGQDPEADTYVPSLLRFYNGIGSTGINYGAIVTAVHADDPKNQLLTGDVIVSVNEAPCQNAGAFLKASIQEGSRISVLRADDADTLQKVELLIDSRPDVEVRSVGAETN